MHLRVSTPYIHESPASLIGPARFFVTLFVSLKGALEATERNRNGETGTKARLSFATGLLIR